MKGVSITYKLVCPVAGHGYRCFRPLLDYYSNYSTHSKSNVSSSNYCLDMVRNHDYENFLCTLLLPNSVRKSAVAIRAFNIEVANVHERVSEPRIGQMRLQFWIETLDKLFKGNIPEHPVSRELYEAINAHKLQKRYLKQLITSRMEHILSPSFDSLENMEKYAEQSVSSIYYLLLQSAGIENVHADHAASHLGKAQGITNMIRSTPHSAPRRIINLPQDILLKHGVAQESLIRGKNDKSVRDVMFDIAARAKQHLDKARNLKKNVPKEAVVLFLPSAATDSYLERLRKVDFDVFHPNLQRRNHLLPVTLYWQRFLSRY